MSSTGSKLDRPSRDAHLARPRSRNLGGRRPRRSRAVLAAVILGALLLGALLIVRGPAWFGNGNSAMAQQVDHSRLDASTGSRLSATGAHALETTLATNPGDVDAHVKLVGYYFSVELRQSLGAPRADQPRTPMVVWLIDHHPALAVLSSPYGLVDKSLDMAAWSVVDAAWSRQVSGSSKDAAMLGNAAYFYASSGDFTQAQRLYQQAQSLDQSNAKWPTALTSADLAALRAAPNDGARSAAARLALAAEEQTYSLTPAATKTLQLPDLAKTAFLAGDLKKATDYARLTLQTVPAGASSGPAGNAIHDGHMVLGRVAAAHGDLDGAAMELQAAGNTPGSPQLTATGPNMSLARDLLLTGRRETVLAYFAECAKFWGSPLLAQWQSVVTAGGTPDFGANLWV